MILPHFDSPYHKGQLAEATCSHTIRNPVCGDQVTLQLSIEEPCEKISTAYFDGHGCIISQAACSILCQHVEGKTLDDLRSFEAQNMLDLLTIPLTATRTQCGLLAFKALKTLIHELDVEWVVKKL